MLNESYIVFKQINVCVRICVCVYIYYIVGISKVVNWSWRKKSNDIYVGSRKTTRVYSFKWYF